MTISLKKITVSVFFFTLALLGIRGTSLADSSSLNAMPADAAGLPSELGEIVYRKYPERPFQVYIIGNSHRSSSTGDNGVNTVPAQIQTYRIGEWLIRHHQVELLLPEGFFGRMGSSGIPDAAVRLDGPALEETLADTSTFINADLLLHRNYGIGLQQVEDRDLYLNVRQYLLSGLKSDESLPASFGLELEYLQERRSAAILQGIPAVIDNEYRLGNIAQPRAILTIGMAHLNEIITFLELGKIEIPAPRIGASGFQAYSEPLELLAKEIGVTVIVPRAILDDRETTYMAKLEPEPETSRRGDANPPEGR
jgi:hypothetical protein